MVQCAVVNDNVLFTPILGGICKGTISSQSILGGAKNGNNF